jgi:hypothetical protein
MGCHDSQESRNDPRSGCCGTWPLDFTSGLSFVAISQVKSLKGLAFRSQFDIDRLQKVKETDSMETLRKDNE